MAATLDALHLLGAAATEDAGEEVSEALHALFVLCAAVSLFCAGMYLLWRRS